MADSEQQTIHFHSTLYSGDEPTTEDWSRVTCGTCLQSRPDTGPSVVHFYEHWKTHPGLGFTQGADLTQDWSQVTCGQCLSQRSLTDTDGSASAAAANVRPLSEYAPNNPERRTDDDGYRLPRQPVHDWRFVNTEHVHQQAAAGYEVEASALGRQITCLVCTDMHRRREHAKNLDIDEAMVEAGTTAPIHPPHPLDPERQVIEDGDGTPASPYLLRVSTSRPMTTVRDTREDLVSLDVSRISSVTIDTTDLSRIYLEENR